VFRSELSERDLGPWPDTDTPDIGERYIVERMLGQQPQLQHEPKPEVEKQKKELKTIEPAQDFLDMVNVAKRNLIMKHVQVVWGTRKKPFVPKPLLIHQVQGRLKAEQPKNGWDVLTPELRAEIRALLDEHEASLPA
jgi:hypothetical protein